MNAVIMCSLKNTRWLVVSFVLLIASGCGSEKTPDRSECVFYEPHIIYEKWDSDEDHHSARVRGNPREIIDSVFFNLEDTVLSTTGTFVYYKILRFDEEGHRTLRRLFLDSTKVYDQDYTDCTHRKYLTYNKFPNDTDHIRSFESILIREKDGTFRVKYLRPDSMYSLITFIPGENEIREETWLNNSLLSTSASFYKDGLLKRTKSVATGDTSDHVYYYDTKGNLDSSVYSGSVSGKKIYFNNEQGDVVLLSRTEFDDSYPDIRFKYEYDAKGNWIRRIGYVNTQNDSLEKTQRYPYYSLVKRYIKY